MPNCKDLRGVPRWCKKCRFLTDSNLSHPATNGLLAQILTAIWTTIISIEIRRFGRAAKLFLISFPQPAEGRGALKRKGQCRIPLGSSCGRLIGGVIQFVSGKQADASIHFVALAYL